MNWQIWWIPYKLSHKCSCIEGGWSGVVLISYPKAHVMVDLHLIWTYIPSLCNSGNQWMCSHHSQFHLSNQARVTVTWFVKNLLFWEWLKWCGAIAILQGPCHGGYISIMDIYTNSMQLQEVMHVLTSPSTSSIHPGKGHCSLVYKNGIYRG